MLKSTIHQLDPGNQVPSNPVSHIGHNLRYLVVPEKLHFCHVFFEGDYAMNLRASLSKNSHKIKQRETFQCS